MNGGMSGMMGSGYARGPSPQDYRSSHSPHQFAMPPSGGMSTPVGNECDSCVCVTTSYRTGPCALYMTTTWHIVRAGRVLSRVLVAGSGELCGVFLRSGLLTRRTLLPF